MVTIQIKTSILLTRIKIILILYSNLKLKLKIMGKSKEDFTALREKMLYNAEINKDELGEKHWEHCAKMVKMVLEAEREYYGKSKIKENG